MRSVGCSKLHKFPKRERLLRLYFEHFFKVKFYFHCPRFPLTMERHLRFAVALHSEIAAVLESDLLQCVAKARDLAGN